MPTGVWGEFIYIECVIVTCQVLSYVLQFYTLIILVSAAHEMEFILPLHFKGEETEAHRGKESL